MNYLIVILFIIVAQSDETDCIFSVSGKSYNLSPLKGRTATGSDSKMPYYSSYKTAVCADMADVCKDELTGQTVHGVVYALGGELGQNPHCWALSAKWDSVTAMPLDPSAGVSGRDGLTLSFQNGDPCRASPRKLKMNMICDTNEIGTITGFQDDSDSCLLIINFPTLHACSSGTPKPSHSLTRGMPSQSPTYHGPQITAQIEIFSDSSCSIRSSDHPSSQIAYVPRGLCVDLPYDPDYPDDGRSQKYECLSTDEIEYTTYNETGCSVTRDKQTLSVGQCTVFDTDDDNKPILWQKLSQLQGCAPIHKPTTAMPSQAPTYSGPQINLKAKYYDDSLCSHQTGEEQTYLPKDRCIDIPYDPYFPDDPRSARAECIGNNGVEYTQYNKTSCSVVKDTIKLIIGECIVSDTDENGTPNEWMEVVELDGCSPTHKPTPAMPSQAPTYYGPQIEVKLHKFYNSSCTNRTDDPPESDSIVKDRCIDDQEDGSSRNFQFGEQFIDWWILVFSDYHRDCNIFLLPKRKRRRSLFCVTKLNMAFQFTFCNGLG